MSIGVKWAEAATRGVEKGVLKRPAASLKKRLQHMCFPVNLAKFLRTTFLQNTSGRLLLNGLISIFYKNSRKNETSSDSVNSNIAWKQFWEFDCLSKFCFQTITECVKVSVAVHQVLPVTGYIFKASFSTSATRVNKI